MKGYRAERDRKWADRVLAGLLALAAMAFFLAGVLTGVVIK